MAEEKNESTLHGRDIGRKGHAKLTVQGAMLGPRRKISAGRAPIRETVAKQATPRKRD